MAHVVGEHNHFRGQLLKLKYGNRRGGSSIVLCVDE